MDRQPARRVPGPTSEAPGQPNDSENTEPGWPPRPTQWPRRARAWAAVAEMLTHGPVPWPDAQRAAVQAGPLLPDSARELLALACKNFAAGWTGTWECAGRTLHSNPTAGPREDRRVIRTDQPKDDEDHVRDDVRSVLAAAFDTLNRSLHDKHPAMANGDPEQVMRVLPGGTGHEGP